MSRLDHAMQRFNKALDQLDAASQARPKPGPVPLARELQGLREDRQRLAQELAGVKADYAALEALTNEVEARVDGAIRDIRRAIAS